jgi:hypothetical protein
MKMVSQQLRAQYGAMTSPNDNLGTMDDRNPQKKELRESGVWNAHMLWPGETNLLLLVECTRYSMLYLSLIEIELNSHCDNLMH